MDMSSHNPPSAPSRTSGHVISAHDQIVRALAQEILTGALAPGDKLPLEADLLERFGVFGALYRSVLHPVIGPLLGDKAASLVFAIAFVAFWWLLMWAMAKRGIRISV